MKQITYKFYRPTPLPIKAKVKVKLSHGYPNNYEQIIKDAIVEFIGKLQINKTIEYSEFVCMLNNLRFNFIYTEILINKKSENELKTENVSLHFTEMASITHEDITVEKDG